MNFEEVINKFVASEKISLAGDLLANLPVVTNHDNWLNFAQRAALAVNDGNYYQANLLLKNLTGLLLGADEATRHEYEPVLTWLHYAALDDLPDGDVEKFFSQRDWAALLKEEPAFNLLNKARLWLAAKPITERDALRERVYNAARENGYIFIEPFLVEGERGSVANWLKEYDKAVGFDLANALSRVEFENQAAIAVHLKEPEKSALKKLYDFYEFIKLSSTSLQGFEEDIVYSDADGTYLFSAGKETQVTPVINKKAVNILPAKPRAIELSGAVLPALAGIIQQAQAQLTTTNGETPKVILELQKNLSAGQALGVLASLLLLAQLRRLDDVLSDAPDFRTLVAQDLEKNGQTVQKEGLAAQPNAPQFLARFLKIILQDNLQINANGALSFGQRLGELMALESETFRQMVIVDERGQAKWNI